MTTPFGELNAVGIEGSSTVRVRGWTIDPETSSPIDVHFYVDGVFGEVTSAFSDQPVTTGAWSAQVGGKVADAPSSVNVTVNWIEP